MTAPAPATGAASVTAPARVTAFTLTRDGDGVADTAGSLFDVGEYSRMKHGDIDAIATFGVAVARAVLHSMGDTLLRPEPVLLPVAYMHVPPTCFYLAQSVAAAITHLRAQHGLTPARVIKISKDSVTATDYAASTAQERAVEMARISFTLDESVTGAHVILVDDVRVTGLAEATGLVAISADHPATVTAAYIAVVDETLADDPSIEARLNHATVASVTDMASAAADRRMVLTIRLLKRLLGASATERAIFLDACASDQIADMLNGAYATGPDFLATFTAGVADLEGRLADARLA